MSMCEAYHQSKDDLAVLELIDSKCVETSQQLKEWFEELNKEKPPPEDKQWLLKILDETDLARESERSFSPASDVV